MAFFDLKSLALLSLLFVISGIIIIFICSPSKVLAPSDTLPIAKTDKKTSKIENVAKESPTQKKIEKQQVKSVLKKNSDSISKNQLKKGEVLTSTETQIEGANEQQVKVKEVKFVAEEISTELEEDATKSEQKKPRKAPETPEQKAARLQREKARKELKMKQEQEEIENFRVALELQAALDRSEFSLATNYASDAANSSSLNDAVDSSTSDMWEQAGKIRPKGGQRQATLLSKADKSDDAAVTKIAESDSIVSPPEQKGTGKAKASSVDVVDLTPSTSTSTNTNTASRGSPPARKPKNAHTKQQPALPPGVVRGSLQLEKAQREATSKQLPVQQPVVIGHDATKLQLPGGPPIILSLAELERSLLEPKRELPPSNNISNMRKISLSFASSSTSS